MHTYVHIYIPWVCKCVTKTIECGTSHKYTSIHNFYSLHYYRHFAKQYYKSALHVKIKLRSKRIEAALNFALSFLRVVTLGGKVCKILMPA